MDLQNIEAKQIKLQNEIFDMNQVLKDLNDLFDLELNDRGIRFKVKIDENISLLSTDQR